MRLYIWLGLLSIIFSRLGPVEAIRYSVPEGPTGATVCSNKGDDDVDDTVDAADTTCAEAAAFTAITGGFAANAADLQRSGAYAVVTDGSSPAGDYVQLPPGRHPHYGGVLVGTGITAGTYYLKAIVQIESTAQTEMWISVGPTVVIPPDQAIGARINSGQLSGGWVGINIGSYDQVKGDTGSQVGINTTPQRLFTFATGDRLHIFTRPGLKIACISAHASPTAQPACPAGEQAPAQNYVVKQYSTEPTVDGTEDSMWAQADAINLTGFNSGVQGTSVFRVLWKDTVRDRVCYFLKHTQANLVADVVTPDSSAIFGDTNLDVRSKYVGLQRVRDANTYTFVANARTPTPTVYDRNDVDGVSNPDCDLENLTVASSYSAGVLIIEACHDIPVNVAQNQLILADMAISERVTGSALVYRIAHCPESTIVNPTCWGGWTLSPTVISPPADTTAPTVGALAFAQVTSTSMNVSFTASDAGSGVASCELRRDTNQGDNTVLDSITPSIGAFVGGSCTFTMSGLTPGTTYEWKGTAVDGAGNRTNTTVADQSSGAASGDTFYISTTGSNSNDCSTGSRCATVAGVMAKAAFGAGDTIVVGNGTYGNGKFPQINCATNVSKFNGTSSARITLRAENERQALFQSDGSVDATFRMSNCSFWNVEGLRVEGGDFQNAPCCNGPAVYFINTNNLNVRRMLVRFNNRYKNGAVFFIQDSSNSLYEENEIYSFHRHGYSAYRSSNLTLRRNYANSRSHADIPGGAVSADNAVTRGDASYTNYPGSDTLYENNISVGSSRGWTMQAISDTRNNRAFGNISISDVHGLHLSARGSTTGEMPIDNRFVDFVVLDSVGNGFTANSARGTRCDNCTITNTAGTGLAIGVNTTTPGDGNYSFFGTNILVSNSGGTGVFVSGDIDSWSIDEVNSFGNGLNYSPATSTDCSDSTPHCYTNQSSVDPQLTSAICISRTSPMAGAGIGAKDIGANVLYRYENVALTTQKLWTQSKPASCPANTSGWYLSGMGECISGVNASLSNSLVGLADRLGITTAALNACVGGTY